MKSGKFLIAAAATVLLGTGAASTALAQANRDHRGPVDHRAVQHERHEMHRPYVSHERVIATLRSHRYRVIGDPYFLRGHYVVRSHDRRGRAVFVEIDPWSGAFIGEFRR